jgi:hypothetical protein
MRPLRLKPRRRVRVELLVGVQRELIVVAGRRRDLTAVIAVAFQGQRCGCPATHDADLACAWRPHPDVRAALAYRLGADRQTPLIVSCS